MSDRFGSHRLYWSQAARCITCASTYHAVFNFLSTTKHTLHLPALSFAVYMCVIDHPQLQKQAREADVADVTCSYHWVSIVSINMAGVVLHTLVEV